VGDAHPIWFVTRLVNNLFPKNLLKASVAIAAAVSVMTGSIAESSQVELFSVLAQFSSLVIKTEGDRLKSFRLAS
jgi:predicted membrane-bound spermidine synthase